MPDLSILIPARNERWLSKTVEDMCAHTRGDTDVIIVLDGAWPEPGYELVQHPDVQVIYLPQPIGQRAATNLAARVSTSDYICKIDAHCSVADGFDVALLEAAQTLGPDVTQIPEQRNLHVFDWQCDACGKRTYQGPTPTVCDHCHGTAFHRELVWQPRAGTRTTSWRFDRELKFQYWGEFRSRPEARVPFPETLSCLGACWFLSRERYWHLGGLDEQHGSWGQMGTEIACKSWLSGGRMVVNTRTWFAHLFRTQGGDFSFPYPLSGREVDTARKHSRWLWLEDNWPHATQSLSWLLDKFAPVPEWTDAPAIKTSKTPQTKGLVYYSDCRGDARILVAVRERLAAIAPGPLVSVTLQAVELGTNIVLALERGILTMFQQILTGLEALDTDLAFLVEHDVLYHPSHFTVTPTDPHTYVYNQHCWKVNATTGQALFYYANQTSGLCADRQLLVNHYRARVQRVAAEGFSRSMGFEPGTHKAPRGFDDYGHSTWMSEVPNIDIRHGCNLTQSRWRREQFRNQKYCQGWDERDDVPGWGVTKGRFDAFLAEHCPCHPVPVNA